MTAREWCDKWLPRIFGPMGDKWYNCISPVVLIFLFSTLAMDDLIYTAIMIALAYGPIWIMMYVYRR